MDAESQFIADKDAEITRLTEIIESLSVRELSQKLDAVTQILLRIEARQLSQEDLTPAPPQAQPRTWQTQDQSLFTPNAAAPANIQRAPDICPPRFNPNHSAQGCVHPAPQDLPPVLRDLLHELAIIKLAIQLPANPPNNLSLSTKGATTSASAHSGTP